MKPVTPLPIDPLLPKLVGALDTNNAAIVTAEPGAGKTTRVPPALLSASFIQNRQVWVLQPRRLAAKLAALRVAEEKDETPGRTVGYQFRFEKCLSPETRLVYLTDGMLFPLSQADPELSRVAAVVLDEFHERSLALETGLAWLRRLQLGPRSDLRLIVMSATLDAGSLSTFLSGCPVFNSPGRVFPVDTQYLPLPGERDLGLKVRSAVKKLAVQGKPGTILVFLPGMAEIRHCREALAHEGLEVAALYGDLPVSEQQKVLHPSDGLKVNLSTNLAETSLTIPAVTAVVDAGLTRQSRVSAWSSLQSLVTVSSSQASAVQRAGRAGRVIEGTCIRLYTKFDFEHRAAFDLPELLRSDLSKTVLDFMLLLGADKAQAGELENLPWFLKPPPGSLEGAVSLLKRLGALDAAGSLTPLGRRMARFPMHPRLAKFLLEAEAISGGKAKTLSDACRLAALISEEMTDSEDLLGELEKKKTDFETRRLEEQFSGLLTIGTDGKKQGSLSVHEVLAQALLTAFPDRVAQLRQGHSSETRHKSHRSRELLLCSGGTVVAGDSALTRENEYFVVVEAQETAWNNQTQLKARALCPIQADWLLDLLPGEIAEEKTCEWNEKAGRLEGFSRLKYGQLVLDEKPLPAGGFGDEAAQLFLKKALAAGVPAYCDEEELETFLGRVRFMRLREKDFPVISAETVQETLLELCKGCRSLNELKKAGLVAALAARLSSAEKSLMDRLAPTHMMLTKGRRTFIHYETGKPPWIQSRIQDFFGMNQGPAVAGGEVPLVLHLCAPNQRPVQITGDLPGFWKNHYPQVRQELMRRYPRHKWPENPV